jgi:hypothetical protein
MAGFRKIAFEGAKTGTRIENQLSFYEVESEEDYLGSIVGSFSGPRG